MILQSSGRQRGFTLVELLVVIAIIGLLSSFLIPNLLDALQKAKQKRTVGSIRDVGAAWFSWMTDEVSAAAAGSTQFNWDQLTIVPIEDMYQKLIPADGIRYANAVPESDHWGNPMDYAQAEDLKSAAIGIAVRSLGRDGEVGPTEPPYPMGSFVTTSYDEDIVWSDGFFVRYPAGVVESGGS